MTTFAAYMEQTLYGPDGYYASGAARSGKEGDYFTAPDTGPAFGQLLAEIICGWQRKLGITPFHVVEAGAGEGALAHGLGRILNFPYIAIERSPARQAQLRSGGFTVFGDISELAAHPVSGCLLANELLDAFPVHRVRVHQGKLQEAYVDQGQIRWDDPSTPKLAAYLQRIGVEPAEGYETEINLAMADWFQSAAAGLKQGLILLIDYGRPAHEYYAPERDRGTLRGFRKHQVFDLDSIPHPNPLPSRERAKGEGWFDLTADVDFTSAALDGKAAGLTPLAFMEMGSFLIEGARAMASAPRGLQYLIHPDGLGSAFHVLILGKDVPLTPADFPNNRIKRLNLPLTPPSPARGEGVVTKGD